MLINLEENLVKLHKTNMWPLPVSICSCFVTFEIRGDCQCLEMTSWERLSRLTVNRSDHGQNVDQAFVVWKNSGHNCVSIHSIPRYHKKVTAEKTVYVMNIVRDKESYAWFSAGTFLRQCMLLLLNLKIFQFLNHPQTYLTLCFCDWTCDMVSGPVNIYLQNLFP